MNTAQEVGIVIKIMDYQDNDQIITVLTRTELITFIALGVRKITSKNRIALQLGNLIEVELFRARLQGKLSKLKKAKIVKQVDFTKSDTALVIMEIMQWFKKLDTFSSLIFKAYIEGMDYLGDREYNHHFKVYILTRFLDAYGIWPVWNKCVECGRQDKINGFEFYKGGFTCNLHTSNIRTLEELKAFQVLGISFEQYKNTSHKLNFYIFKELITALKNNT